MAHHPATGHCWVYIDVFSLIWCIDRSSALLQNSWALGRLGWEPEVLRYQRQHRDFATDFTHASCQKGNTLWNTQALCVEEYSTGIFSRYRNYLVLGQVSEAKRRIPTSRLTCETLNENIGCPVFLKLYRRKSHRLTKKIQALIIENPPNAGIWDLLPGPLRA